jgi:DNA-binding IscR family transcriptional regulator
VADQASQVAFKTLALAAGMAAAGLSDGVAAASVIEPAFLAQLRRELRAELVITLVQIEQLVPNWWPTLTDLAEQLGTDRSTLNRALAQLDRRGLLRRVTRSNGGGTWIWWVKRSNDAQPDDASAPRWILGEVTCGRRREVIVGQERAFAAAQGLSHHTVRGFLAGHRPVLAKRWRLISSPLLLEEAGHHGPAAPP